MVPIYDASYIGTISFPGDSVKEERPVWPERDGIAAGVFRIRNRELGIPIMTDSKEPMTLREGGEIGHWGTEKWREGWEDLNPLMIDSASQEIKGGARQKALYEQVKKRSKGVQLGEEIKSECHDPLEAGKRTCEVCVQRRPFQGNKVEGPEVGKPSPNSQSNHSGMRGEQRRFWY
ncbi:hypothetical protein Aduo_006247 [Ancylostoma duodenale]